METAPPALADLARLLDEAGSESDPLQRLRHTRDALAHVEVLRDLLLGERDALMGSIAASTPHGYRRIARAAGVSPSRASRIARENGAPMRVDSEP